MPTKKPRVQTILEYDVYEKFKELAEREKRSESQLAKLIIEEYIENYQSMNKKNVNIGRDNINLGNQNF